MYWKAQKDWAVSWTNQTLKAAGLRFLYPSVNDWRGSRAQRVAGLVSFPPGDRVLNRTGCDSASPMHSPAPGIWVPLSRALAGWMSRSFFLSLFQTQEQLVKVWTNESLQVLDVLAAPCHPASHSVLLP